MKKTLSVSVMMATLFAMQAGLVLAQPAGVPPVINPSDWGGFGSFAEALLNGLFLLLIIVSAIAILIAGFFFVTAAGNPDTLKKARDFLIYALVGVVVGFGARALAYLVASLSASGQAGIK